MRNFRTFNNTPVGNDPSATDYLGAININNFLSELEASVSRSGQTLSSDDGSADSDTTQLAKSLFIHSTKATAFQAGGSANAIELTPVSGASGVLLPPDYTLLSGMRIAFSPAASNTGAVTVNIGQTAATLLGVKSLLSYSGAPLTGGELTAAKPVEIQYDGTNFRLLPWSSITAVSVSSTAQAQAQANDSTFISPLKLKQALQGSNQSLAISGYQIFPGGLILQWGRAFITTNPATVTFPITYPNGCFSFVMEATTNGAAFNTSSAASGVSSVSNSSAVVWGGGNYNHWISTGY
jgi:hypothetical protein